MALALADSVRILAEIGREVRYAFYGILAATRRLAVAQEESLFADSLEALVRSGRRRLRPVLMTSLAAALGMLPLAYGLGAGADMLKPFAIAVIGALCISVLLSLIATPTLYVVLAGRARESSLHTLAPAVTR